MKNRRWLLSPIGALQTRYRSILERMEMDLETKGVGLPSAANWTQRMTQVILVGIVVGVGWSIVARVDVVVNANGKLEPLSQSQVIQSRVGGNVTAVLVHEGEPVKQGQLLMQLDKKTLYTQLQGLLAEREQLVNEIAVLRLAHQSDTLAELNQGKVQIPPELMNRVQTRMLLVAQLTGNDNYLAPEQRSRFELFQRQLRDRQSLTQLQDSNIQTQIAEANAQMAQTGFQLRTERELLGRINYLADQGAIARVTVLQRKVGVGELQKQLIQNNLQKQQLEVNRIQAKVEQNKVLNETQQDLQQQLAALDAQFGNTIKENQRQLIQVTSQLSQIKIDLKNQDLRAPVDGVVFSLGPKLPGIVAQPGQTLLQIIPSESLTARVHVANADIANIRVGMPVDIRVAAYSFTEFGSIKGVVSKVGGEAVKLSDDAQGATVFPIEIRLERQFLERGSKRFTLSPGMSLTALIKVRQRAPISYVTEEITKAFDGVQSVR
jgi:hemolysin D